MGLQLLSTTAAAARWLWEDGLAATINNSSSSKVALGGWACSYYQQQQQQQGGFGRMGLQLLSTTAARELWEDGLAAASQQQRQWSYGRMGLQLLSAAAARELSEDGLAATISSSGKGGKGGWASSCYHQQQQQCGFGRIGRFCRPNSQQVQLSMTWQLAVRQKLTTYSVTATSTPSV